MRIGLIAPPFIPVPPPLYGGTELFVAQLATGLKRRGFDVVVYTNGESTVDVETRWTYEEAAWPIANEIYANLKDIDHAAWAVKDAAGECDLLHLNNAPGISYGRFVAQPMVYTVHHPKEQSLSDYYAQYPEVHYVAISKFQKSLECMPRMRAIPHGLETSLYQLREKKQGYLSFIGRLAPVKGVHLAIEVAKRTGIPLKIAGEVQPVNQSYYEDQIKPHVDGKLIEYIGEANLADKNELLGNSMAMLFPIQWNEPFGFVMLEAMACGTPVLALPGGSVREVVCDGVSGYVCSDLDEMVARVETLSLAPRSVRQYVDRYFSSERMVAGYADLYRQIMAGEGANSQRYLHDESRTAVR